MFVSSKHYFTHVFLLFHFSGVARYTDCKMFIRFAISDDGMKLVVNGKLETHNHDEVINYSMVSDAM